METDEIQESNNKEYSQQTTISNSKAVLWMLNGPASYFEADENIWKGIFSWAERLQESEQKNTSLQEADKNNIFHKNAHSQ